MRNNGRFTSTEEAIALGGGELFDFTDQTARHRNIEFPGHKMRRFMTSSTTPSAVTDYLLSIGVKIVYHSRIEKLVMTNQTIHAIGCKKGKTYAGDVFVDATGTAGPMANCKKYGNGCAMCILRCPSFGGRVSLTGLAGVTELVGKKSSGAVGAMSGSCKLFKESLSPEIVAELNEKGVALVPVPQNLVEDHLDIKACQQYALAEFRDNIVLLDTGHAKLMSPYFEIHRLQQIPGLEKARYEDPYSGGQGNSMRFFAMAPRDNTLAVEGVNNLFCAGEKAGLLVGHTEAIVTGTLAGYNAARVAKGLEPIELPRSLVIAMRSPMCVSDADRKGPRLEIHLLRLGIVRAHAGAGILYDRHPHDPPTRRTGRPDRRFCVNSTSGGFHGHNRYLAPRLSGDDSVDHHSPTVQKGDCPAFCGRYFPDGTLFHGSSDQSNQVLYNALVVAGGEFLGIIVVIALVVSMTKTLATIGADELMIRPLKNAIHSNKVAFFVVGAVMLVASWFIWPSPAVALVGALLLPFALRAGLPAIWAAVAMNLFGHGIGLSSDFFIQGAPSITAKSAGVGPTDIMVASVPIWLVMSVVTIAVAFVMFLQDLKKNPQMAVADLAATESESKVKITTFSYVMAVVTPLAFVLDVFFMITLNIVGGDATAWSVAPRS